MDEKPVVCVRCGTVIENTDFMRESKGFPEYVPRFLLCVCDDCCLITDEEEEFYG